MTADVGEPGKRSRTEAMTLQRRASSAPAIAASDTARADAPATVTDDPFALHLPAVQRAGAAADTGADVHDAATRGIAGPSTALPHAAAIQAAFGPAHDVAGIEAHVGGAAAEGAQAMGATAFATGHHVGFASAPDLHTAAHEAAHVVQQAHGVSLYGGVGEVGDPYEQHADRVADRVVAGQSAADLLPAAAGGAIGGVQRQPAAPTVVQREVKPTGGPTTVSHDTKEVMDDFATGAGEQTIVLETSTSTTGIGTKIYFDPDTLYGIDLDLNFFRELASPTGKGLLDLAHAAGPKKDDLLDVGGTKLTGKKPQSLTFVLRGTLRADKSGYDGAAMTVQAANNGMLNIARLASDYITAARTMRTPPAKLALVCKVNFGTDPNAKDEDARKENALTTVAPMYTSTWNSVAGELTMALLGGLGFAGEFVSSDLWLPDFKKKANLGSARSMAEWAEAGVNKSWRDTPTRRTFVTEPVTGTADAIMAKLAAVMGDVQPAADYDPAAIHDAKYKGTKAIKDKTNDRSINTTIRSQVIQFGIDIANNVILPQLTKQLAPHMKAEISTEFDKVAQGAAASWATAYKTALDGAGWVGWYNAHVVEQVHKTGTGSTGAVTTAQAGSGEGFVANPLRVHEGEAPVP